jgi:hypothetical protein
MPFSQSGGGGSGSSGAEISYTQITSTVNVVSTTEATGTTILSPGSVNFDGTAVLVEFFAPSINIGTNVNSFVVVSLFEGATQITRLVNISAAAAGTNVGVGVVGKYRFTPTAAAHTYTVTAFCLNVAGTPAVSAGPAGTANYPPAYVRFTRV